jgi:hypothetical protein
MRDYLDQQTHIPGAATLDVKSAQATGNAALFHVAWELARRGWNVMPTPRNAKGSDLYCSNDDESIVFGVQSKGLSRRAPVGLGPDLRNLRSQWWIITVNVMTDDPTCYVLTREEVEALCHRSDPARSRTGAISHWLQPRAYDRPAFREGWDRLLPAAPQAGHGAPLSGPGAALTILADAGGASTAAPVFASSPGDRAARGIRAPAAHEALR